MVAKQPSDMGSVLLLHMPIVVLLLGTQAGEPRRLGAILEMAQKVRFEELRAVVGSEAQRLEWQGVLHLPGRLDYLVCPLFQTARLAIHPL